MLLGDFTLYNGKVVASLAGEEKHYAFDIKTTNGKSRGKANNGSYIYKDKDKPKRIVITAKNGKVVLTFLNKD